MNSPLDERAAHRDDLARALVAIVGASSIIICSAVNCDAPATTSIEKAITCAMLSPASVAATPKSIAKGIRMTRNGNPSRIPRLKFCRMLVDDIGFDMYKVPSPLGPIRRNCNCPTPPTARTI